jgi:hypothetical protein
MLNYDKYLKFSFLYHKPQLCLYVIHIMIHLHLTNDSWKFEHFEIIFRISKNFEHHKFFNYEWFSYVDDRLSSYIKKFHQFFLLKKSLT